MQLIIKAKKFNGTFSYHFTHCSKQTKWCLNEATRVKKHQTLFRLDVNLHPGRSVHTAPGTCAHTGIKNHPEGPLLTRYQLPALYANKPPSNIQLSNIQDLSRSADVSSWIIFRNWTLSLFIISFQSHIVSDTQTEALIQVFSLKRPPRKAENIKNMCTNSTFTVP